MIDSDRDGMRPTGLERIEAALVDAMHAYVSAAADLGSEDRETAIANLVRVRQHFRACVREWAIEAHLAHVPPEQALVRVKALLRQFLGAPEQNVGIAEQAVAWAIAAYYEGR